MEKSLWSNVMENLVFVLVALAVAVGFVLIAYLVEKYLKKKNQDRERILSTRKIAMIGVFSAIAMVLHIFDNRCGVQCSGTCGSVLYNRLYSTSFCRCS